MAKKTTKKKAEKDTQVDLNILESIKQTKDGSRCAHGRGDACSMDYPSFGNDELPHKSLGLDKDFLMRALKTMMKARYTDEKHLLLIRQGKSFFHIGVSGHEGVQTAVAMAMETGKDWGWTYYRDLAYMYAHGYTPRDYFLLAFGKKDDPSTGGRQMPNHYGRVDLNHPTSSSSTGTQFLNAVGNAMANKKNGEDSIVYVASGEGTTSQGEFYEAVNWASREKLPVLFCVQDNGYAISVPREKQSMGTHVGHSFCCYSNLRMKTFDGSDFFESYKAAKDAVEHIRKTNAPALLHADVERLLAHSSSDDQKKYRDLEHLETVKTDKDPIIKLGNYMVMNELATQAEIDNMYAEVKKQIDDDVDWALAQEDPNVEDSTKHIFAPEETRNLPYAKEEPKEGKQAVLIDAITHTLDEELARNDKMLIFGQDVADPKGGVFTATKGLSTKYGEDRVFNSPLAEASIVGVALGLAVRGYKPVVEIQFGDYIWPAFQQIRNELSTMRYRSDGNFSSPVVIRVPVGGYIHGGLCHSQNIEAFFSHIPGLMIAYPSTAMDAKGLLRSAIRMEDPVLFLEHKGMYRLPYARTVEPDENYMLPFGKGKIIKGGSDITVVTYGMGTRDSLNAAKKIEKESGKTVEIIDLRTIVPWDKELVLDSLKKTGKLLVVHEDIQTMGFGAEISATINQEGFELLDAPVRRMAAKDSPIPYAPVYEDDVLPNEHKIKAEIEGLLKY